MKQSDKIHVALIPAQTAGGPKSMACRLKEYLNRQGFLCEARLRRNTTVMIIFVKASIFSVFWSKLHRIPILLRLDGLYYFEKHGVWCRQYITVNIPVKIFRDLFADIIIYQSHYAEKMCNGIIGPTKKPRVIVHNGINSNTVPHSMPSTVSNVDFRFVTTGNFRNRDMLPVTVQALEACEDDLSFTLDIYGKIDTLSRNWIQKDWIRYEGMASPSTIAESLCHYHAMIYTQINPSCPNTVIEAISAGIPVIAFDSGSVTELITFNAELIAPTPRRLFHRFRDLNPDRLAGCIRKFAENPYTYRSISERNSGLFDEKRTLVGYKECINKLIRT